ncbi:MAG: deoxynucleoside kinase [Alistipes senegalensis]|nr:deoxynucleoside kinase [Alistipes senegalensis]
MGKLIVIEGLDGSGKHTQAVRLYEYIQSAGKAVKLVSFPDYESPSSSLVKMYLAGDFGKNADSVNPYAASTFYAVDRFASFRTKWHDFYENGGIVIADRYTTSNAVHQCAKLPPEQWDSFIEWLTEFEYRYIGIPEPDMVIYLRTDTGVSQKLMSERYNSDESKKDIHERDMEYLTRSQRSADYCAEKMHWYTIQCSQNGVMRSVKSIAAEIKNFTYSNNLYI